MNPAHGKRNGRSTRIPNPWIWAVAAISISPFVLNLFGVDFASAKVPIDPAAFAHISTQAVVDEMHRALSGSLLHTILEWSAFCTASFTVILAFVNFKVRSDVTTAVVGVALFSAGCMDAFHTLAADRLIHAVADNRDLIPFTWALCRLFNALIMIVGVGILLLRKPDRAKAQFKFILTASVVFGLAAYAVIQICAHSESLPQTMFKEHPLFGFITRPYDVAPLILFVLAGLFVFRPLHKRSPSLFSHALIVSLIPAIATQAHMAFGSEALFDNHFNIAHFLKIIQYFVPFAGLSLDYVQTFREQQRATELAEKSNLALQTEVQVRIRAEKEKEKLHHELLEVSHHAGRAEVAAGVLHNVGNVLNSVNVSVNTIAEKLHHSKIPGFEKATAMLEEHSTGLAAFLSEDPKGRRLPSYLAKVARHLGEEHEEILVELASLTINVDHIKQIVNMQQSYA